MGDMFNVKWTLEGRKALGTTSTLNLLFGLWPLEKDGVGLKIRWSFTSFVIAVVLFQAIYEIYLDCVHTENNADNLYSISFGMIGLAKMFFYYSQRNRLQLNVESAIVDWSSKDAKKFRSIMHIYRKTYKRIARGLLLVGISTSFMFPIKVFFVDPDTTIEVNSYENGHCGNLTAMLKKRFLLPAACSLNEASHIFYWAIITAQIFQYAVLVGVNLSCDTFFIAITYHLCGQFEILKSKFANMKKLRNVWENRQEFGVLIVRHRHLLKLADQLEYSFNLIVFVQMMMNLIILIVAGFNFLVLLKKGETLGAISNASVMSFALVQTFMYSYIGDMLTSQGDDIAQSVYDSEWYAMPSSFSKDIVIVMVQTSLLIGLSAGKFFKMTRSTFTDIVKTAVSYLSVLRILIDEKKL